MLSDSWKDTAPIYTLLVKSRGGRWCVDVMNKPFAVVAKHAKELHIYQQYPKESLRILETCHNKMPDFILDQY